MSAAVTPLAGERLLQLANTVELDGRLSSHPLHARGFAPFNCFLLVQDDVTMLIDTSWTVHEQSVLDQLRATLRPGTKLHVWAQRIGEYPSMANLVTIIDEIGVERIYDTQDANAADWFVFRSGHGPETRTRAAHVPGQVTSSGSILEFDEGRRRLHALEAPLRLLPTIWIYDELTKTLFTSDAFTYAWQPTDDGPWVLGDDDPLPEPDQVLDFLLNSRFWWLAGARTKPLREAVARTFTEHEVTTIAPAFGCVIQGRSAVARHLTLLDEVLERAGAMEPTVRARTVVR